ncbi:SAM-dependent methyltransferase [Nonomuraea sp. 3-1Str]|uniref:SAM-dependent methyltransferase n=1 Tax=Nonomuraea sp. 3-1Str TaxID=2929801 RepID=UPI00285BBDA4|nr:SAM-dependent methyltransferase [Nonomuraea sp. 3-1Str]MDR8412552.1 SAM-dependent methyltransferase [Nonomuraea sp. 3-1Str]
MSKLERVPPGVDPRVPSVARVYDYLLGGKDHLAVDRAFADKLLAVAPETRQVARANRLFLVRAVRHLARRGVRQFLDLGTGIPTSPSVHEVAREIVPDCRVVYVDYDPVVRLHSEVLLASSPGVEAVQADLREPGAILGDPRVTRLIDFSQPVGVLMVGILHFILDSEDPAGIIADFRTWMAPGSHLILTHAMADSAPEAVAQLSTATAGTPAQSVFRTREEVLRLAEGFELIGPGLAPVHEWRIPDDDEYEPPIPLLEGVPAVRIDAAVGRVTSSPGSAEPTRH